MRNKSIKIRKRLESSSRVFLLLCGAISVFTVILITIFIVQQGLPTFKTVPIKEFLFSTDWSPSADIPHYGVASFVVASIEVTLLSMIFALPIALSSAIYLSEFAKGRFAKILRSGIELLAGIPSIIYGLFGIAVVVPFVRNFIGGNGYSLLSASIILAIMILPTIINFSEVSIKAVPDELKAASIAMGATTWQTIYRVTVPSALSGIVSSIILALGRAIGETTAVVLVGGNAPIFSTNPIDMGRTLTMNIITDMSYAEGVHMSALFATAMLLFIFILLLNLIVVAIMRKERLDG
ncbi:MAG: phosphate ABC transporter permease subunit PstC [Spirochaetaceae bacterium]|nr:phosphate ABC transporter permease subunit PstC [Spirochaetaceae bacterium]